MTDVVYNHELETRLKWLWDLVNRLPAGCRDFGPVNDILRTLKDGVAIAERGIQIAEQIWIIEHSQDRAIAAAKRVKELMEIDDDP